MRMGSSLGRFSKLARVFSLVNHRFGGACTALLKRIRPASPSALSCSSGGEVALFPLVEWRVESFVRRYFPLGSGSCDALLAFVVGVMAAGATSFGRGRGGRRCLVGCNRGCGDGVAGADAGTKIACASWLGHDWDLGIAFRLEARKFLSVKLAMRSCSQSVTVFVGICAAVVQILR